MGITRGLLTLTAGLIAAVVPVTPAAAASPLPECAWSMTPLPLPAGYTRGSVSGAAAGGWVVGEAAGVGGTNVRWHNGQVEELGHAFGKQTELLDVNSSGVAVGLTYENADIDGPVVYRNGGYERLPIPVGMRRVQAKAINDAGDIVGTANSGIDNVNVALWPAASPGTVVVINPDPAQYYYAAPIDIDEQGRILIETEGGSAGAIVRFADGTFSEIPPTPPSRGFWLDGFRNGRVVGRALSPTPPTTVSVEVGLDGRIVHQLSERAKELMVDSGTTIAGVYRGPTNDYNLGIWNEGVLTHTLFTSTEPNDVMPAALTDDGVLAATIGAAGAVTYRRTC